MRSQGCRCSGVVPCAHSFRTLAVDMFGLGTLTLPADFARLGWILALVVMFVCFLGTLYSGRLFTMLSERVGPSCAHTFPTAAAPSSQPPLSSSRRNVIKGTSCIQCDIPPHYLLSEGLHSCAGAEGASLRRPGQGCPGKNGAAAGVCGCVHDGAGQPGHLPDHVDGVPCSRSSTSGTCPPWSLEPSLQGSSRPSPR